MRTKNIDISPQIIESIRRVLLRGETAQVKYNKRDGVIKVFGMKMKLEESEETELGEGDRPVELRTGISNLAKAILNGERITAEKYD